MDEIQKHGQMKDAEEEAEQRGARTRSPAYPGISLEAAIKRTRELYIQDKMNPVPLAIVVKRWGYKPKSSAGLITAAALKSFGLVRDSGTGSERKLQVTEHAHKFFLDTRQDSQERDQIIKDAALRPKIHSSLWKKWGTDLPSDETLDHALKADWAFNPNSVSDFIKEYKDTIRFAKLTDSDSMSTSAGDKETIKIGNYVSWESQGILQFEAKRVIGLSDDGTFAFVEGSNTGFPIDQLVKFNAPNEEASTSMKSASPQSKTMTPGSGALSFIHGQGLIKQPVTMMTPTAFDPSATSTNTFPIPLRKQNQATISFTRMPLEKSDLDLLKKWIELMEENLTEPLPIDQ